MKRIRMRVGRSCDFWIMCIILILLNSILLFSSVTTGLAWGEEILTKSESCFLVGVTIIFCIFTMYFIKDISCFIICENDKIILKMPFCVLQTYSRQELKIRYAVRIYKGRSGELAHPCVIVGSILPKMDILSKGNYRKTDNEYFLLVLNERKLDALANWWQKEIELPNNEGWEVLCDEWQKVHMPGVRAVEKFYRRIEDYNTSIKN